MLGGFFFLIACVDGKNGSPVMCGGNFAGKKPMHKSSPPPPLGAWLSVLPPAFATSGLLQLVERNRDTVFHCW